VADDETASREATEAPETPEKASEAPEVGKIENGPQEAAGDASQADNEGAAKPASLAGEALELARLRAVVATGLSGELVECLGGSNAEEIQANARKLAEYMEQNRIKLPPPPRAAPPTGRDGLPSLPIPNIPHVPSVRNELLDPAKIAAAMAKRLTPMRFNR